MLNEFVNYLIVIATVLGIILFILLAISVVLARIPFFNNLIKLSLAENIGLINKLHIAPVIKIILGEGIKDLDKAVSEIKSTIDEKVDSIKNSTNKAVAIDELIEETKHRIDNNCSITGAEILQKIKDKYWDETTDVQKYKLLTNLGVAKGNLIDTESSKKEIIESANLLVQALNYNKNDEKALCNAAIGKINLNKLDEAIELAKKAISQNPTSDRANSIIVSLSSSNELLEEVINKVPVECRELPNTAKALGEFAFNKKGDKEKALYWFNKVLESDEQVHIEGAKAYISYIHTQNAMNEKLRGKISQKSKENLATAIEYLTELWNKYAKTEMRDLRTAYFLDRVLAKRLLGKTEEALRDYEVILESNPQNETLLIGKANLMLHADKVTQEIIDKVEGINSKKGVSDTTLLLIDLLVRSNEPKNEDKALIVAEKALENHEVTNESILEQLLNKLFTLYMMKGRIEDAEKIKDELQEKLPNSILSVINDGIFKIKNNLQDGLQTLDTAYELAMKGTDFNNYLLLAETYFQHKIYDKAAKCYEMIVDIDEPNYLLDNMLTALYFSDKKDKALEVLSQLRKKQGLIKTYVLKEASLLFEIANKEDAKKLLQEFLNYNNDDESVRLELATYNFVTKDFPLVDEYLDSKIDIKKLSMMEKLSLSSLLSRRNKHRKAVEIAYSLLEEYPSDFQVNQQYSGIFLMASNHLGKLRDLEKITIDTVVCIEWDSKDKWYLIQEKNGKCLFPEIVSPIEHSHIIDKLLGKSIGDKVELGNIIGIDNIRKIKKIEHKYVFAFDKSMEHLKTTSFDKSKIIISQIDENITKEKFEANLNEAIKRILKKDNEPNSDSK